MYCPRVTAARSGPRLIIASLFVLLVGAVGAAACGRTDNPGSATTTTITTTSSSEPASSSGPAPSTPLSAPKVSAAQDAAFLTDVTEADPALATYVQTHGNVALRALLTDGSAFCAFLQRDGGIDNAMVDLAVGARSVEGQTHLPTSVTTFNAVEAVALLTLCPSYQKLLPASGQAKIRDLGSALANHSG
jgi:hypothetical protein